MSDIETLKGEIKDRIEEIESDSRYETGEDAADVRVNAPLALQQATWDGEIKGLYRAYNLLDDI